MCEVKTFLGSVCLILSVTACFSICRVYPERQVGHHSKIEVQGLHENEYKKYCLNCGECYYLTDEDVLIVTVHGYMEENSVKNSCGGLR